MVHKYHAKPQIVDNLRFDSKKESLRYIELKTMQRAKLIRDLEIHPNYLIWIEGQFICTYKADFQYTDSKTGESVTEDCKGIKTPVYRLKKKLFEVLYKKRILET